jgi:integrase
MQHSQDTSWRRVGGVPNLRTRTTAKGETQFAIYYRDRDTGKQVQRTLAARTLKDAKKEVRATLAAADARTIVAPSRVTIDSVADELVALHGVAGQCRTSRTAHVGDARPPAQARSQDARPPRSPADHAGHLCQGRPRSRLLAVHRAPPCAHLRRPPQVPRNEPVRRARTRRAPVGEVGRGSRARRRRASPALTYADAATRPLIETAALSGLRQSELLALRWQDVDFDAEVIRVRHQLSRGSRDAPAKLVPLKTDSSAREVVLVPALATILRERRAKAMQYGHHAPESFVFSTRNGTPISQRNANRSLARIARAAKLNGIGYHTLRHGFASTLIVELRLDPVVVSRQLGHARPSITLDRYSHLFDRARHADDLRERLGASELAAVVSRS